MKSLTESLRYYVDARRAFVNIAPEIRGLVEKVLLFEGAAGVYL